MRLTFQLANMIFALMCFLQIKSSTQLQNFRVPNVKYSINKNNVYLKSTPSIDDKIELKKSSIVPNELLRKFSTISDNSMFARISLLCVSALYGSNFSCVKIINGSIDPSLGAFLRFSLAGLVFLPALMNYIFDSKIKNKSILLGGMEVGLYNFLGYWAQANSLVTSSASSTAFICSLAVVVVPILDIIFSKQQNRSSILSSIIPALLAVCGIAVIELGGTTSANFGDLLACLQPLFFGLSFWRIESFMKPATKNNCDVQAFTGAMLGTVSLLSILWVSNDFSLWSPFHENDGLNNALSQLKSLSEWKILFSIFWTGLITTALTTFIENIAMKKLSASESTIIYSTEPLWGTVFAASVLNESLGWNTLFGAVLILSACLWSSLGGLTISGFLTSSYNALGVEIEEVIENLANNINLIDIEKLN